MLHRRLALLLALLLSLGACGGDDSDDAVEAGATSSTSQATASTMAGETSDTSTGGATGVDAGTGTTAKAGPATTARAGGTAASGPGKPVTPGARLEPVAPGKYTYTMIGKRSSPAFGEQPVNGEVTAQIDPARGRDQRGTESSPDGSAEQVLRFGDDGVRLVSMRTSQAGFTKEFRPAQPVLILPWPITDGQTWAWKMTSTDGATTVDASFRLARREPLTIGGEKVDTLVIESKIVTSGDVASTSNETIWVAPTYRLIVKEQGTTDGSFGGTAFHTEQTRTLKSTRPA